MPTLPEEFLRRSKRAGVEFPVRHIHRRLRNGHYANRVTGAAAVYTAAVLEYLTAEVLEQAGNASHADNTKSIKPQHINLVAQNDEELTQLIDGLHISNKDDLPNPNPSPTDSNKAAESEEL